MGILYIVSTPIGNLNDITIRAIKVLFSVDAIACEDTRVTGKLLHELQNRYPTLAVGERPKLIPYHDQNEHQQLPYLIKMLETNNSLALVSDSGTPLLSDPGFPLVRECIKRNIPIISIPGPSSILAALLPSGLPSYPFLFLGYPPEKSAKRQHFFRCVKLIHFGSVLGRTLRVTTLFFASPHKIIQILEDFRSVFGDRPIVVARELTKIHEEFIREPVSSVINRFKKNPALGELVVLFTT